ncbi:MAG: methionyl-tRNA formyltransferase [Cyclobacteriaceae bacterium]|nr:methionyl-tRNA formyltransferase [Cyclobacteriaceae bacterium]
MGTPEFAIPSLEILINNDFNVAAVITAPDKPRGRGRKLSSPPVKEYALGRQIPVLQPRNLKDPEFIRTLREYKADLQVVVAFRMLPEVVWSMPELGTFNLHASLLPQYRGAAPVNWVLINGEKKTGVTTFFIKQEIDTGNIIHQEEEPVYPDDDAGTLHDRLMIRGARLVLKTVRSIAAGNFSLKVQQDQTELKPAPKITREMCRIDWDQSQVKIHNFVRGLSPYPAAWTEIDNSVYKVYRVSAAVKSTAIEPGRFETDNRSYLHFQCADGLINIIEWQPEGKRRMSITEFFRGNSL